MVLTADKTEKKVSFLEGNNPFTFAIQTDAGSIPNFLFFTHLTSCKMSKFQKNVSAF